MSKWRWFKWFMHYYAKVFSTFCVLLVYTTFLLAYISPAKEVCILVDFYGESSFELVFLTFVVPFCIYFLLMEMKWMLSRTESKPADRPGMASSSQSVQSQ